MNRIAMLLGLLTLAACTSAAITPTLPVPVSTSQRQAASRQPPTVVATPQAKIQIPKSHVKDCPDSKFTCITLVAPLDHFDPANTETISVTFGLLRATGKRKGLYVTAVGGPAAQRAEAYLRAGDKVDETVPRLSSVFYGDLPCVFWSVGNSPRPPALKAIGIPTLVLGATADPATPVENARNIYRNLSDGYLILKEGGSHVSFGYGDHCPDDLVTAFLVDDQRPPDRETTCPGDIILPYGDERRMSR